MLLGRRYLPVPLAATDREREYYETLRAADEGEPRALIELISRSWRSGDGAARMSDSVGPDALKR